MRFLYKFVCFSERFNFLGESVHCVYLCTMFNKHTKILINIIGFLHECILRANVYLALFGIFFASLCVHTIYFKYLHHFLLLLLANVVGAVWNRREIDISQESSLQAILLALEFSSYFSRGKTIIFILMASVSELTDSLCNASNRVCLQ